MISFATFAAAITSRSTPREYGVTSEDFAFGPKTISFSVGMAGRIYGWGEWGGGCRSLGSVVGFAPTPHPRLPTPFTTIIRAMFVLYEALLELAHIAALPYFLVVGMLRGKYLANFPERVPFYKTPPAAYDLGPSGLSVGQTLA